MHNWRPEKTHRLSSSAVFPSNLLWLALGLFQVLLLCGMDLHGSSAEAQGAQGPRAKRGETTFQQHCLACHNKQPGDSMPFGAPNLHGIFHGRSAITTKQAEDIIVHGKGSMPAWGAVLTHSDIDAVVDYLKTW